MRALTTTACLAALGALADALSLAPRPAAYPNVQAVAVVTNTTGATGAILGTFTFTEVVLGDDTQGLSIQYSVAGLVSDPQGYRVQVNTYGDLSASDGSSTGGIFEGSCTACRPGGIEAVGLLGNGLTLNPINGVTETGNLTDSVATLRGVNTILGRSIVILSLFDDQAVVAAGVIGRMPDPPAVAPIAPPTGLTFAVCNVVPTISSLPYYPRGQVNFTNVDGGVAISWTIRDATPNNPLGFHIHVAGDLTSENGTSALGHYIGNCSNALPCRPPWAQLQEVGMLLNTGVLNSTATGATDGQGIDNVISLQGAETIVGRSTMIHFNSTMTRIGHCVVGVGNPSTATALDCVVSAWSDWSDCSCSSDLSRSGSHSRSRTVVQSSRNGGAPCPVLTESESCTCPFSNSLLGIAIGVGVGGLVIVVAVIAFHVVRTRRRERPSLLDSPDVVASSNAARTSAASPGGDGARASSRQDRVKHMTEKEPLKSGDPEVPLTPV